MNVATSSISSLGSNADRAKSTHAATNEAPSPAPVGKVPGTGAEVVEIVRRLVSPVRDGLGIRLVHRPDHKGAQEQQKSSVTQSSLASLAASTAMTSPAIGSAHHQPSIELARRPPSRAADI